MKWNGQTIDLIHQSLNLLINLDFVEKEDCIIQNLHNETWSLILSFLSINDIANLKFLSKRFYKIVFFDKKMKYFSVNSHNLFDIEGYYHTFFSMIDDFFYKIKKEVDELTFLFLKYSFEELKNIFMISNILYHLFSCPRSIFVQSNCDYCSRLFISESIRPINFNYFKNFVFQFSDGRKEPLNVFFNSLDEFSVVNSSRKKCLTTFIVQDYFQLVLVFFKFN